jgi:hypothetical protein
MPERLKQIFYEKKPRSLKEMVEMGKEERGNMKGKWTGRANTMQKGENRKRVWNRPLFSSNLKKVTFNILSIALHGLFTKFRIRSDPDLDLSSSSTLLCF